VELTENERKQIMPMERIKLVMTRGQDDENTEKGDHGKRGRI